MSTKKTTITLVCGLLLMAWIADSYLQSPKEEAKPIIASEKPTLQPNNELEATKEAPKGVYVPKPMPMSDESNYTTHLLTAALVIVFIIGARWRVARKVSFSPQINKPPQSNIASKSTSLPIFEQGVDLHDEDDYDIGEIDLSSSDTADIMTPNEGLLDSAYDGILENVKYYLQQGANINVRDKDGETPLMWAAQNGQGHIVKHLVQQGADINIKRGEDNAISIAMADGHKDIATYLCMARMGMFLDS